MQGWQALIKRSHGEDAEYSLAFSYRVLHSNLLCAASFAGLVKCVLMLNHHSVSPNVHFYCLNPHVDMNGYPCQISVPCLDVFLCLQQIAVESRALALCPKDQGELLDLGSNTGYAGVSSFGFGGTNARADIWAKAQTGFRDSVPLFYHGLTVLF